MSTNRSLLLAWAEQGAIAKEHLPRAFDVAGVTPSARDWHRFLDRLLLFSGAALLAAGAIFFVAYNWAALGRFSRLALLEALILASTAAYCTLKPERAAAKAALLVSALLMGALLALFGQTYQTGADTWELFAVWAALILPWALAGQLAALWLLWLLLVNLAVVLYFQVHWDAFGLLAGNSTELLMLVIIDAAALALWEWNAPRVAWLQRRWGPRMIAFAAGSAASVLLVKEIFDVSPLG